MMLERIYLELGIGPEVLSSYRLPFCAQAALGDLEVVDVDFEGRAFILLRSAGRAWRAMRLAAEGERVRLDPFSGFRSYVYQKQLIERKLAKGRRLEVILTETAIPGFSEHHSGCAVDVCTDGQFVLDEGFEKTEAFQWLTVNAGQFGFRMSYPRQNEFGIIFEPWHWRYAESGS